MNLSDARTAVLDAIRTVAPDAPLDALGGDDDLIETLELDSMDVLNIAVAVSDSTGIEIPERDYPKLVSIEAFASYLASGVG